MRVHIQGCGVVGTRAARQLLTVPGVTEISLYDEVEGIVEPIARSLGAVATVRTDPSMPAGDVVVLAHPAPQAGPARAALLAGSHVVTTSDDIADIDDLLRLDAVAVEAGRTLIVGAGFSPGLTCVLASHAAVELDRVDEVHVAKIGTAGPACARQHHRALKSFGRDWRDGRWIPVRGGSGRELLWFPDPIAGADCYRAALPDPLLLHELFPGATRITARMAATRRDRLTSVLPMMRSPHAEAGVGAVRVELRGQRNAISETIVLACMDRPSVAAATVAAVAVGAVLNGEVGGPGARGLGASVDSVAFLGELARRGVKCARFEGASATS